jgi:hypothetical protein
MCSAYSSEDWEVGDHGSSIWHSSSYYIIPLQKAKGQQTM